MPASYNVWWMLFFYLLVTLPLSFTTSILEAQDRLYFVHRDLFSQRRWPSDIPAALDILMGGGYPRLPHSIQNCGSAMDRKPLWLLPRDKTKLTEVMIHLWMCF